jgi:hypothetical protein
MLYREIIAVCSQIHTQHINTRCGQNVELYIKTQTVPRSKHTTTRLQKPASYCRIGKQSMFVTETYVAIPVLQKHGELNPIKQCTVRTLSNARYEH